MAQEEHEPGDHDAPDRETGDGEVEPVVDEGLPVPQVMQSEAGQHQQQQGLVRPQHRDHRVTAEGGAQRDRHGEHGAADQRATGGERDEKGAQQKSNSDQQGGQLSRSRPAEASRRSLSWGWGRSSAI